MNYPIEVNIHRPTPGTDENRIIIEYIEPLRKAELVQVSNAYRFNLEQYMRNEECSYSPGFKYMFWFKTDEDSKNFLEKFGVKE